jgi:phosphosulfolactate phosphohydrolase-like enzyme
MARVSWRPPGGAPAILTGAFVNAGALAEALAGELAAGAHGAEEVVVVGCGWEGRRASEDEAAAGAILARLRVRGVELDRRARRVVGGLPLQAGRDAQKQQRRAEAQAPGVRT